MASRQLEEKVEKLQRAIMEIKVSSDAACSHLESIPDLLRVLTNTKEALSGVITNVDASRWQTLSIADAVSKSDPQAPMDASERLRTAIARAEATL